MVNGTVTFVDQTTDFIPLSHQAVHQYYWNFEKGLWQKATFNQNPRYNKAFNAEGINRVPTAVDVIVIVYDAALLINTIVQDQDVWADGTAGKLMVDGTGAILGYYSPITGVTSILVQHVMTTE